MRLLFVLILAAVSGCSSDRGAIHHVVFITLTDPQQAAALVAECGELKQIPGVQEVEAGTPIDTGRSSVAADYDVGIYVRFGSEEDYRRYVDHPVHVRLVGTWKPRWRSIVVRDFGTRSPSPRIPSLSVGAASAPKALAGNEDLRLE